MKAVEEEVKFQLLIFMSKRPIKSKSEIGIINCYLHFSGEFLQIFYREFNLFVVVVKIFIEIQFWYFDSRFHFQAIEESKGGVSGRCQI